MTDKEVIKRHLKEITAVMDSLADLYKQKILSKHKYYSVRNILNTVRREYEEQLED